MGEIEVNEYVRTKEGYIIKVDENTNIFNLGYKEQYVDMETTKYGFDYEDEIVKHSKQLIDLIEVGDIVNKELVIGIIDITNDKEEIIGRKLITQYRSAQFTGLDIKHYIYDDDIKTILTHEQFEQNSYKVGGEDEN